MQCRYLALFMLLLAPTFLLADTDYYDDEAAFLAATGDLMLESFEDVAATNSFTSDTIVLPGFTVTGSYQPLCLGIWDMPFVGGFATDGANWLGYQSGQDETLVFDLAEPATAFGLNVTDWGDFGEGQLIFSNDLGESFVVDVTPHPDGNQIFFGVWNTSVAFTQVIFTQSIAGEFYGVDEIYFGVPSSVATQSQSWTNVKALFE